MHLKICRIIQVYHMLCFPKHVLLFDIKFPSFIEINVAFIYATKI